MVVFHTVGSGGEAMEEMIREEEVEAVIDLSLNELVNHLLVEITMPVRTEGPPHSRREYPQYWSPETLIS